MPASPAESSADPARSRLPRFLRALGARNYRLFFSGQIVSLMGTWMTFTASLWLGYHLRSSAFLLGLVGFAGQVPIFFLSPLAGVWVDRTDKRRLLIGTQILSLLQSGALAALTLTGHINIWSLIALNLFQGTVNAFDMTARQAFVIQLVDRREDMGNAIALNSSMFNLARLLGPGVGGLLIASVGAGYCYLVDALSYLPVIVSLWMIRPRAAMGGGGKTPAVPGRVLAQLRAGIDYAFGFPPIGATLLLVAATSFAGFAAPVVLPILARDVFGGDARTLGWMMSASGVGALAGAIYLSTRTTVRGLGTVIVLGGFAMGAGLIGCGLCRTEEPALVCLAFLGAGGVLLMASGNTVVQSLTDDDKRGRVMSLFAMAFTGTTPLGNLMIGALAGGRVGVNRTLMGCGVCCALCAGAYLSQLPKLRLQALPVLERKEAAPWFDQSRVRPRKTLPMIAPVPVSATRSPPVFKYGASACARLASGSDCNQTRPGPVSVARKIPSPPKSMLRMPGMREIPKLTCASNIPTCPGCTRKVSPGPRS